jgi:hypothetical protein
MSERYDPDGAWGRRAMSEQEQTPQIERPCARCRHPRAKHQPACAGDSKTINNVFTWRPCVCKKWIKSKVAKP